MLPPRQEVIQHKPRGWTEERADTGRDADSLVIADALGQGIL
jgi:hypothetical protein